MPFTVAAHDGVLTLTLDTPRSPVNIFNHATATQLIEILGRVTAATTRAIVFRTAKPNSFINGVGLLLAQASRTADDVVRASTPPWTAYRAVREAPVPTIAVVEGSCFGCGVEFALSCDYRIAGDSCETRFYMTELNDYLFIPLFGSTWNLPDAVGLADAIDLLLWGERWGAEKALERGLVDAVAPHEVVPDHAQRFVQQVLEGARPSRRRGRVAWGADEDATMERARRRVAALPAQYHEVYGDALDLLEAGARQSRSYVEQQSEERRCSTASALSPIGKAAYGFFYIRQIASERAAGRARGEPAAVRLALDLDRGDEARGFADDLRRRKLPRVTVVDAASADYRLVAAPSRTGDASTGCPEIAVRVSFASGPSGEVELYAPTYRAGGRLIELAIRDGSGLDPEAAALLTRTLQRFGFEVVRTTPGDTFVGSRLLTGYLVPLVRFVERGGDVGALNGTLRRMGFVRGPDDLLAALDRRAVAHAVATAIGRPAAAVEPALAALESERHADGGDADGVIVDALCIALLDALLSARTRREIPDTAIGDVIARELLDFPRHLCSLASWLKIARVKAALDGDPGALVTEAALESARAFVARGRELYR